MTVSQTIDVSALIEERPISGFQWRTLLVCLAVLFMDGYDTQAIGYVAPALVQAWHLDRAALAPVFALGLVGMMLGGLQVASFSGDLPTPRQYMLRAIGYLLSAGTCFLGFLWVFWDEDSLTWHDRLSQTYLATVETFVETDISHPATAR